MKTLILRLLKSLCLQPLWEKLHHVSLIGMNYWGGSEIKASGEIPAIKYIFSKAKNSKNDLVVFDVGANTGGYLRALCENIPNTLPCKIYSFEPSSSAYKHLNTLRQEITSFPIFAFNFGFSNKEETIQLRTPYAGASIASVYALRNPIRAFKDEFTELIPLKTIDTFCNDHMINEIFFLKMDVEGHELKILQGAENMIRGKKIRFIQFEFGDCNIESKVFMRDFYDLLSENYRIFRILPSGLRQMKKTYTTDVEVFATANYLAELI